MQYTYSGETSSSSSSGLSSKISATGDMGLGGMICLGTDPWAQQSVDAGSGSRILIQQININSMVMANNNTLYYLIYFLIDFLFDFKIIQKFHKNTL